MEIVQRARNLSSCVDFTRHLRLPRALHLPRRPPKTTPRDRTGKWAGAAPTPSFSSSALARRSALAQRLGIRAQNPRDTKRRTGPPPHGNARSVNPNLPAPVKAPRPKAVSPKILACNFLWHNLPHPDECSCHLPPQAQRTPLANRALEGKSCWAVCHTKGEK